MEGGEISHSDVVLRFDSEGVDVEYRGREFRMRRDVVEGAAGRSYLDVTDHEVARMVDRDVEVEGPARRIGDVL